jgi:AcrR family transcriptional regulator
VAASKLPDHLVQQIHELAAQGITKTEVAARTGVNRGTVKQYWPADVPHPEPVRTPVETESERWRAEREKKLHQEAIKQAAAEVGFRAFLEQLIRDIAPTCQPKPIKSSPRPAKGTAEELLTVWSDWHMYEVVTRERTLGLNEYDAEIGEARARRVVDTLLTIKGRAERGGQPYRKITVAANGDMISGSIHEVEKHSDAENVIEAAIRCGNLLGSCVEALAAEFELVEVFGTTGNHGRLPDHRRMPQKDPTRNWDYLIYRWAEQYTSRLPNVRWFIPPAYSVIYQIHEWNFHQNHGHEIRSWNQIPFYGIIRRTTGLNAIRQHTGQPIHYTLCSHFHNAGTLSVPGGEVIVNGSLIGATEYSVEGLGRADKPSQWLLSVHPEHGVTTRWPIYAEGA